MTCQHSGDFGTCFDPGGRLQCTKPVRKALLPHQWCAPGKIGRLLSRRNPLGLSEFCECRLEVFEQHFHALQMGAIRDDGDANGEPAIE